MSTRAEAGRSRPRLWSWGLAYTPAAAFALLLPKCPLCIAAPLALLGVSVTLPSYVRVLAIAASLALGTLFLWVVGRRACVCGRGGETHCAERSARIAAGRSRIV